MLYFARFAGENNEGGKCGLGFKEVEAQILDGAEMFLVPRGEDEIIFHGGRRDEGIPNPETVGDGVFFDVNGSPVADILRQGKNDKAEIAQETFSDLNLLPGPGPL